jgi:hypothetical protein
MKLSAFLLASVPLVAAAQPTAAIAGEQSDSWLKESLASLKTAKPTAKPRPKVLHASTPMAATLKLRPFVPNRYLPSEREMQRAMVAQQAQMDPTAYQSQPESTASDRPLQAQISEYNYSRKPISAYDSMMQKLPPVVQHKIKEVKNKVVARAPRAVAGLSQVLPEQFVPTPAVNPIIPEPPRANTNITPDFQMSVPLYGAGSGMGNMYNGMNGNGMYNGIGGSVGTRPMPHHNPMSFAPRVLPQPQPLVEAPNLSSAETARMDKLVAANMPTYQSFNGDMSGSGMDNPGYGAGPPPFPLNLLPLNAMQSLGNHGQKKPVITARFGSWHQKGQLPYSGFHTYISRRRATSYTYTTAALPSQAKKSRKSAGYRNPTQRAM